MKPCLSDKISESNHIVSDEREICDIFKNFFGNVVPNLNISEFTGSDNLHEYVNGLQSFLYKYRNHPSII